MVLKIGDIIKLLVLILVAILFPIEVNAHKGEHNFKEEKQDRKTNDHPHTDPYECHQQIAGAGKTGILVINTENKIEG